MISLALTIVILIWNRDLLLLFGASENTISYATSYMSLYALGTIFVQMTLGLNAFITAQGFAKDGMMTVPDRCRHQYHIGSVFIFALHMGVRGAALCYHSFPGMLLYLVHLFSAREKDLTTYPQGKLAQRTFPHAGLCCLRAFCLYHAVYREYHIHVL